MCAIKETQALGNQNIDTTIVKKLEKDLNKKLDLNSHEKVIAQDIIFKDKLPHDLSNIGGYAVLKKLLKKNVINPYNSKSKYLQNGLIFHGPPGTGKTYISKCLAKELNCYFINFNAASIEDKLFGESAKFLKALFSLSEKLENCVIFIDEIDGFCGKRSSYDQHINNSLKTQFLSYIDGIHNYNTNLLFIGATNRLDIIDDAFKRRLRLHIKIDNPTSQDIQSIFETCAQKHDVNIENLDINMVCDTLNNFSCSDINDLCTLMKLNDSEHNDIKEIFNESVELLKGI